MTVRIYTGGAQVEVIDEGPIPDTTPPETMIVAGPSDSTSTSATITFAGSDAEGAVTFEGRLDSEAFHPVTSPMALSNLAVGPHVYEVRAVDAAGNVDGTPAGVAWSVLPPNPPPVTLTLIRRSPASPQVEYGGFNFQFNKAAIMAGGKIHHVWNGTWEFDLTTFAARKVTVTNSDGTTPTTRPENADMVYVPTEGVVYVGNGAPVGPSHSFDPTTNVKTMTGWALDGDTLLVHDAPRNRILSIGGYTPPMKVRALDLATGQWSWLNTTNNPVISPADTAARLSLYRGGISSQGRVGFFAEGNELSELDGGSLDWVRRPTTGTKPPQYTHFVYYEPLDSYFGWCCANAVAGARTPVVLKFYRLPRSTWAWEELNVAMPSPPTGSALAGGILLADPERQQLVVLNAYGYVELFTLDLRGYFDGAPPTIPPPDPQPEPPPVEPPPTQPPTQPPATGSLVRITSATLPALGNSAPFSSNGSSKHTNMASDGRRLYVSGGDWTHSATDGTHSMSLATGDWRLDHAGPVYPDVPAPHALQDGAGFEWDAVRRKFLLWPGSYFPYEAASAPIREWSRGLWWFDPATNTYEQDARLFAAQYSGTGCLYGGVFDDVRREILAFGDSSSGFAVRRWNVDDGVRLPDVPFTVARDPAAPAAYFLRSRPVKIGNRVYIIGYRTNGERAGQKPLMLRVDLYTLAVTECAPPPVNGPDMRDLEIRPAASHGKVVWPFVNGPDGEVRGIHVYTPAADSWATDTQVPEYGNFVGNSICSLPDGRIAFSGGVFGKQQTHMWFLEAL